MKTILITVLALGFGIGAALAETQSLGNAQLAGQPSTHKPNSPPAPKLKANAPAGGQSRSIPNGGCCAKVNNHCVTICGKAGGCTGSGDCKTNPN